MTYFQTDKFIKIKSNLTNNFVVINESPDQYLVLDINSFNVVSDITRNLVSRLQKLPSTRRPSPTLIDKLLKIKDANTQDSLCHTLNELFIEIHSKKDSVKKGLVSTIFLYLFIAVMGSQYNCASL